MFIFGVVTICQGLVHNYSGLLATRFFLGVAESGMFPACMFLLVSSSLFQCPPFLPSNHSPVQIQAFTSSACGTNGAKLSDATRFSLAAPASQALLAASSPPPLAKWMACGATMDGVYVDCRNVSRAQLTTCFNVVDLHTRGHFDVCRSLRLVLHPPCLSRGRKMDDGRGAGLCESAAEERSGEECCREANWSEGYCECFQRLQGFHWRIHVFRTGKSVLLPENE